MLAGIDYSATAPVFVNWNNRKMSSSLLGDRFTSFLKKATQHSLVSRWNCRITTTWVGKSLVSKVHKEKHQLKQDLANMLCHTVNEYFLQQKMKNVAKTYQAMKEIMQNNDHKEIENLENIFSKELNSKRTITLHVVKAKFGELQNSGLTEVQVRNKLGYIQKKS